ncbi:hypothetical protein AGMMS50212_13010 [Spirochaetia bacterium]|nr:hypothetical protein AGMMS50212_13010 [Spirochaetia bacterium]
MQDIIQGVTTAVELIKKLTNLNEKIKNADLHNLIADLNFELAKSKNSISELIAENITLKEQIRLLSEKQNEGIIPKNSAILFVGFPSALCKTV